MNKAQIKAELRRSACEDDYPWVEMHDDAYFSIAEFFDKSHIGPRTHDHLVTLMLFVAEAL